MTGGRAYLIRAGSAEGRGRPREPWGNGAGTWGNRGPKVAKGPIPRLARTATDPTDQTGVSARVAIGAGTNG